MKRRVVWIHLPLTVLMVMALLMDHILVDGQPASELWQPDLMDELTLDEWPVGEDDVNSNDDLDPMDIDERIYEMEALMADRHEQTKVDGSNEKNRVNNNDEEEEEEEEDDVDQDDYDDEEEDDADIEEGGNQGNTDLLEQQPFDSSNTNDDEGSSSAERTTIHHKDDESILIPASSSRTKATSKLQQQEEQDLEVLDQSIVDTLKTAVDTVKQDKPQRFIPLDENTPTTKAAAAAAAAATSIENTPSSPISLFLTSGLRALASWSSYWILGFLLSLIVLSYRKFRKQPIRDYHHLPSYSVYKQKSSVD